MISRSIEGLTNAPLCAIRKHVFYSPKYIHQSQSCENIPPGDF
jgi:hypothetical protein